VDEVRNLVFSANTQGDSVTVIDGATNQALATLPAGRRPYALAVDPGSSKLYVANAAGEKVFTVVDISGILGARQ
jgi:YVTN family beta-propeller protein